MGHSNPHDQSRCKTCDAPLSVVEVGECRACLSEAREERALSSRVSVPRCGYFSAVCC